MRHIFHSKFLIFLLLQLMYLSATALAADVNVEVFPQEGNANETFRLEVTVKNGSDYSLPRFETHPQFQLESAGTTTSQTIINGKMSAEHSFTFRIAPKAKLQPGDYNTPAGEIDVDGTTFSIAPQRFKVTPADAQQQSSRKIPQIDFAQTVDNSRPFVGQQILHTTKLATSIDIRNPQFGEFSPQGFWKESFGDAAQQQKNIGRSTVLVNFYEALFALNSGEVTIPARNLDAEAATQNRRVAPQRQRGSSVIEQFLFNDMMQFGLQSYEQISLQTEPLTLNVRELPQPPFPAKHIPVGKMAIQSAFDKTEANTGDSITLSVIIAGDGNLRPLTLPSFPKEVEQNFRIYQDSPELKTEVLAGKIIFTKTFKIALVPNGGGTFNIPALDVLTFDPETESYKTLSTKAATITVKGAAVAPTPVVSQTEEEQVATPEQPQTPSDDIQALAPTSKLLETTNQQHARIVLIFALIIPPLCFFALWLKHRKAEQRRKNPRAFARKAALEAAKQTLSQESLNSQIVFASFQEFLAKFFELPYNTTSSETLEAVEAHGGNKTLASEIASLQQELATLRFSGQNIDSERLTTAKNRFAQILKDSAALLSILLLLLTYPISAKANDQDLESKLNTAATAYQTGDFETALSNYQEVKQQLTIQGENSAWLNYNLGNVYFRLAEYGQARAAYLTAQAAQPNETAINSNLKLTETALGITPTANTTGYWYPLNYLSQHQTKQLFLALYLVTWLIAITALKRKTPILLLLPTTIFTLYTLSLSTFTCPTNNRNWQFCTPWEANKLGVIISQTANARTGDADHHLVSFIVKSGELVSILQSRNGWHQIELPDNRSGWVREIEVQVVKK